MIKDAIIFTAKEDESLDSNFKFPINMEKLNAGKMTVIEEPIKKEEKKTKKKKSVKVDMNETTSNSNIPIYQSNENYIDTYAETNNMLKGSINQIDMLQYEIKEDIDKIRASKTLRKKYDYVSDLTQTMGTLIGTKVTAIREMNKTITDSHNLDMKRMKELKIDANETDDNKSIMDMYNAFISTPVGMNTYNSNPNIAPPMTDMTAYGSPNINLGQIGDDGGYDKYINNLSPTQNMMLLENDPNIKTVVVFDSATGNRWFDVMNTMTGESVPNTTKPDQMFLEDTTLDLRNNIARNINLDAVYPLIVLNKNSGLNEY